MKDVTELRDDLAEVYAQAKNKELDNQTAGTLANIAGKMIKSAAVELSYNQFMKKTKKIPFLEGVEKSDNQ